MRTILIRLCFVACAAQLAGCPCQEGPAQLFAERVGSGTSVIYEVRIAESPQTIEAFGVDIQYDTAQLTYSDAWTRGELTTDFAFVGANEIEAGVVRVAGVRSEESIARGTSGVLINLDFQVIGLPPERLLIINPIDDLEFFTIEAVVCPGGSF